MSKSKFICRNLVLILTVLIYAGCQEEEQGDVIAPKMASSTPADGALSVDTLATVIINFTEKINLSKSAQILLNDNVTDAIAEHKQLTIEADLKPGTKYTLVISAKSISDDAGNFADKITIHFTTVSAPVFDGTRYEAELATLSGGATIATSLTGYSGTGYVSSGDGAITFTVSTETAGYYNLALRYSNSNVKKSNDLYIDGNKLATMSFSAASDWKILNAGKVILTKGLHTISIIKVWGWTNYDYMTLSYDTSGIGLFNIASSLVTPNPSSQAVKLYNFLKENFGTKVISGAAPNYSTNTDEADWVYAQTGKWPAITCFDFIDHTNPNQNWVKYAAPFTLGQEWWNNNGIVALMWHWRDPLTKSGSMYTEQTSFDLSRIADTTSAEYKAMIVDIDIIAGYLKQFKDAEIPVLWRPLHEASGTWFWWGAKGAVNCKALWVLMFKRLTQIHGLNNLIWVWTTDIDDTAINWYPGDQYVDIIGMDIYPGENQHGSQYFSYNKVKEIFEGKKIITLSECGSVPDPALMKEYGDMWSYFMPWNGDFTRSDKHNGTVWWNKIFSYDYVITRDKMPSLK